MHQEFINQKRYCWKGLKISTLVLELVKVIFVIYHIWTPLSCNCHGNPGQAYQAELDNFCQFHYITCCPYICSPLSCSCNGCLRDRYTGQSYVIGFCTTLSCNHHRALALDISSSKSYLWLGHRQALATFINS